MQEYIFRKLFWVWAALALFACSPEKGANHDVINNAILEPVRYEQKIWNLDTSDISAEFGVLYQTHPEFTDLYFSQILGLPRDQGVYFEEIKNMRADTSYRTLHQLSQRLFEGSDLWISDLGKALTHYASLMANDQILPQVYTIVSGFSYQCFLFEKDGSEAVGIGLDLFLGGSFPYEEIDPGNPAFSSYLTRTYNPDHLSKKVIEVLVEDKLPPPANNDFLSLILWGGKKLYLLNEILPFKEDTILFEYTPQQLAWCRSNEEEMWNFFFDKNLFFETNVQSFNKLIAPSPYSPGMPREAPGQTGNYMGYRIIQEFMKRHPKTSVQDLILLNDANEILTLSKFKPAR